MGVSVVIRGEGDMKRSVYDPNKDGEIALSVLDSVLQKYIEFRTWNLSYLEFLTDFAVGSQDGTPTGIYFKPNGKKLYVVGFSNKKVYEYDLSTAWDVSTASFNQDFTISGQDNSPLGIYFKSNGTKMYVVGATNNKVYEYDLSTAWDVSTASFNQDFAVGSQDKEPTDICFRYDGTKMYVVGFENDKVYEYVTNIDGDMKRAVYDSDKDGVILIDSENIVKVASDNLRNSHDAESSTSSATYVKAKTFTINETLKGTIRVKFDIKSSYAASSAYGKVYKNGAAIGTEQEQTDTVYATKSEDIDFGTMYSGETIEIWIKNNGTYTTTCRNFRLYYDNENITTISTTNS